MKCCLVLMSLWAKKLYTHSGCAFCDSSVFSRFAQPDKPCSGKLTLRISPSIHAEIASAAEASGKSLNKWIADTLDQVVHAH
jgi:predicted HicB family RNase H-like nuclease